MGGLPAKEYDLFTITTPMFLEADFMFNKGSQDGNVAFGLNTDGGWEIDCRIDAYPPYTYGSVGCSEYVQSNPQWL